MSTPTEENKTDNAREACWCGARSVDFCTYHVRPSNCKLARTFCSSPNEHEAALARVNALEHLLNHIHREVANLEDFDAGSLMEEIEQTLNGTKVFDDNKFLHDRIAELEAEPIKGSDVAFVDGHGDEVLHSDLYDECPNCASKEEDLNILRMIIETEPKPTVPMVSEEPVHDRSNITTVLNISEDEAVEIMAKAIKGRLELSMIGPDDGFKPEDIATSAYRALVSAGVIAKTGG